MAKGDTLQYAVSPILRDTSTSSMQSVSSQQKGSRHGMKGGMHPWGGGADDITEGMECGISLAGAHLIPVLGYTLRPNTKGEWAVRSMA